jgi:hypothetical protein
VSARGPDTLARRLLRTCGVMAAAAVLLLSLDTLGLGLPLLYAIVVGFGVIAWVMPWVGVRLLDSAILALRSRFWAPQQGRHHSFGGVGLRVEDDGRQVWLAGADLQRVLGTRDSEDVLAARLAGHWRRAPDGELLLRVDAVVRHLSQLPSRAEPRVLRLRRYLERELLFPAQQRRERARKGA